MWKASLQGFLGWNALTRMAGSGSDMQRLGGSSGYFDLSFTSSVIQEARQRPGKMTREAIKRLYRQPRWTTAHLEPVDDLLNSVRGGLSMLPLGSVRQPPSQLPSVHKDQLLGPKGRA